MLMSAVYGVGTLVFLSTPCLGADSTNPSWWQRFLPPPGTPVVQQPVASSKIVTADDIAMANQLIQARTMTLPSAVPGASTRVGPGSLSATDRLVLFSLKSSYLNGQRIPVDWFLHVLDTTVGSDLHKQSAEHFWQEYAQTPTTPPKGGLRRALQVDFGWYLDTKMSDGLKASNHRMGLRQKGRDAWRRAVESERTMTEKRLAREETGRQARNAYLTKWAAEDADRRAQELEREQRAPAAVAAAKQKAELARYKAREAEAMLKQQENGQ